MPYIRRDDGAQFVIKSYRELLNLKQISALKREIRALAKKHGENICVFKKDNGKFEIVFSRDAGFLLGETVWNYFNKPRNLIYCEVLPGNNGNVLLVVVKEGSVYIDAKVSYNELIEELAALSTSIERYDIYVYGDVPISESAEGAKAGAFIVDKKFVNVFKVLPTPVFQNLLLNRSLQLVPLELALTSSYFKNKFIAPIVSIVLVGIVFALGYVIFAPSPSNEPVKVQETKDPYKLFYDDLTTPAPDKQLTEINKVLGNFIALPGWDMTSLEYTDGVYTAKVKAIPGGTIDLLQRWAKVYGVSVSAAGDSATLTVSSKLNARAAPKNIYNLGKVVAIFTSKMTLVLEKENVKVVKTNDYQKTRSIDFEISFKDFSPLTFDLIGKLLAGFPLHITAITTSVSQNLFSGSIKLTIWGN